MVADAHIEHVVSETVVHRGIASCLEARGSYAHELLKINNLGDGKWSR